MSDSPDNGPASPDWVRAPRRRRTVQRRDRHIRRRRRLVGSGAILVGALGVLAWLGVTGLHARADLQVAVGHVQSARTALLAGDATTARAEVSAAASASATARSAAAALPWDVLAAIPLAGRPARAVQGLTTTVDDIAQHVLPPAVEAGAVLSPGRLRPSGGRIDVAAVRAAAPSLQHAVDAASAALVEVRNIPATGFIGALDGATVELTRQVDQLAGVLADASTAAQLAPTMLGGDGPRSYFVAFQSNAEARGTGGLVGAFGILRADQGLSRLDDQAANTSLTDGTPPGVDLGPEFDRLYGRYNSTTRWVNSNLSADFPSAAQVWTSLWARSGGQPLDGAVATDPVALSYLLAAVGPVTTPGGEVVSTDNVVALTESQAYLRYPDNTERKAYLQAISSAVLGRVTTGGGADTVAVLSALGRAAREGRLAVWSAHPDEERVLATTQLGRQVPADAAPYAGLSVNNSANGKLDYYLGRSLTYVAGSCAGRTRTSTVTAMLTNGAPPTGLPGYTTIQNNGPAGPPGTNRSNVALYATVGAQLTEVTLDGVRVLATVGSERGHPVFTVDVQLLPGAHGVLAFNLIEPTSAGPARVPVQPLVRPMDVSTAVPECVA